MSSAELAMAAIDEANRDDPNQYAGEPLALAQGRMAEEWVTLLEPQPSLALRLAARAHHLRRWSLPRSEYPEGRAGYLRWRKEQKSRHATDLGEILEATGVEPAVVARAVAIVAKQGLGSDPEVQVLEDAVSSTFVTTQLAEMVARLDDDDKIVEIVAKTLRKMSESGRAAALGLELDDHSAELVDRAVARLGPPR